MFWKKPNKIHLEEDESNQRADFRVIPDSNNPVILQVEGKLVTVCDISAGGVSFRGHGSDTYKMGMRYRVRMDLPDHGDVIHVNVDTLRVDKRDVWFCHFADLTPEQEDRIHQYVLERQKRDIKLVKYLSP